MAIVKQAMTTRQPRYRGEDSSTIGAAARFRRKSMPSASDTLAPATQTIKVRARSKLWAADLARYLSFKVKPTFNVT
jgi:hypothetical protein